MSRRPAGAAATSPARPDPTGLVTDTIEFSAVDGPGNRFVVFLQGCTFDCAACHNPYTISPCIDCGLCLPACPSGALSLVRDRVVWDEAACLGGDECVRACPHNATPKARTRTVADLVSRIALAAPFLSGVTVSGGEATVQAGFVEALFAALRAEPATARLTRFIDTNGDAPIATWMALDPVTDGVMVDLKCLDPALHVQMTGESNERTLRSIEHLVSTGRLWEVRLLLVAGLNDADDLLTATGRWLAALDPRMRIKIMGYRQHGVRPSPLPLVEPTAEQRARYAELLAAVSDFDLTVI